MFPPHLSHFLSSVVAWADLLVSHPRRSFNGGARIGTWGLSIAYILWILLCNKVTDTGYQTETVFLDAPAGLGGYIMVPGPVHAGHILLPGHLL